MKTKLEMGIHSILPGQNVIEIWYGNQMIGTVTGADGPGVRIISKYDLTSEYVPNDRVTPVHIVEVKIGD